MRPTRADTFIEGARFEDAVALCLFDHHLRLCLLDALQQIEIAMRVQIGYQLGKADPFGHLYRESLDLDTCAQPGRIQPVSSTPTTTGSPCSTRSGPTRAMRSTSSTSR